MVDSPDTRLSLLGRLHDSQNAGAWTEFVQIYQPVILSIAQRRGLQYADAMEVTQDVLARIASKIQTWQPDPNRGSFRGWLHQITRNLTVDHLRRQKRHSQDAGDLDWATVACPSPDESQSIEDVAERLGVSRGKVYVARSRVRA